MNFESLDSYDAKTVRLAAFVCC